MTNQTQAHVLYGVAEDMTVPTHGAAPSRRINVMATLQQAEAYATSQVKELGSAKLILVEMRPVAVIRRAEPVLDRLVPTAAPAAKTAARQKQKPSKAPKPKPPSKPAKATAKPASKSTKKETSK